MCVCVFARWKWGEGEGIRSRRENKVQGRNDSSSEKERGSWVQIFIEELALGSGDTM